MLFFFVVGFFSCKNQTPPNEHTSFYFWKTNYSLTPYEIDFLTNKKTKKIYIRCFDVIKNSNEIQPEAVLIWKQKPLSTIHYIPTVFIQNDVFENIDAAKNRELAQNVFKLCKQILQSQQLPINEIQIDCDWTMNTQKPFFDFLLALKKNNIIVSNTLRLYQYKYRDESGVAPTDYATLMCYNMGNLKKSDEENSILNTKDLLSYIQHQQKYPKELNIALPLFNWTLLYHQDKFAGIFYQTPLLQNDNWEKINSIQYLCKQDYYDTICNRLFIKNDKIRIEEITKTQLVETQKILSQNANNTKNEILYFDLDSSKISTLLQ